MVTLATPWENTQGLGLLRCRREPIPRKAGRRIVPQIRALTDAGIPVVGHLGFTPQSENILGGPRVQGLGEDAAEVLCEDALAVAEAGAIAVVLEMVPVDLAARVTKILQIPTIGIGAGPHCDGQVLV
jgi:3-methyl-2-oxobutanoate hydroxymethyltransferase